MKNKPFILWFDTVDSTNSAAKRDIQNIDNLSVLAARYQSDGRGQRGNRWSSADGENLTFSIVLKFSDIKSKRNSDKISHLRPTAQFAISEIATLAVSSYLKDNGIEAKIKWPNDIYVGNKKICGMLIENTASSDSILSSVIGIGLNLNQIDFPPELLNPVSMKTLTGRSYDLHKELERIISYFCKYLPFLYDEVSLAGLKDKYISELYRLGVECEFTDCRTFIIFKGTIIGISEHGLLKVQLPDGSIIEFAFKEISYII